MATDNSYLVQAPQPGNNWLNNRRKGESLQDWWARTYPGRSADSGQPPDGPTSQITPAGLAAAAAALRAPSPQATPGNLATAAAALTTNAVSPRVVPYSEASPFPKRGAAKLGSGLTYAEPVTLGKLAKRQAKMEKRQARMQAALDGHPPASWAEDATRRESKKAAKKLAKANARPALYSEEDVAADQKFRKRLQGKLERLQKDLLDGPKRAAPVALNYSDSNGSTGDMTSNLNQCLLLVKQLVAVFGVNAPPGGNVRPVMQA